ncbi:unnamed protein product [Cylicocyclus nassatus]|uniref:Secreted protein n=1 Tax=Cylicocyclus nassatus TaxID=53992 RepID=A0AA36MAR2_CYLNA|nr:unnamed protein product [Cylicocyclus nassatus]
MILALSVDLLVALLFPICEIEVLQGEPKSYPKTTSPSYHFRLIVVHVFAWSRSGAHIQLERRKARNLAK